MSRGAVTVGIHIFGVRHHGPGCARSLRAALEKLEPDIVLVEGPPDAQEALPWLVSEEMQPPVALLIYAQDKPQHAVFYPFTHFSPEWQALRYALKRGIPARFMDLPQAFQLAKEQTSDHAGEAEETPQEEEAPLNEGANSVVTPARGAGGSQSSTQTPGAATETEEPANPRDDSLDHPRGTSTAREGAGCLFRKCDRGGAAQRGAGSAARFANAWTGRVARGHTDGIVQRKCRADATDPGSTGNWREAGRGTGGDTSGTPAARPGGKTTPPAPQAFARKHEAGPGPAQRY